MNGAPAKPMSGTLFCNSLRIFLTDVVDVGEFALDLEIVQAVDVFAAAHRLMDHRAIAFGVFQADAHRFED